MDVGLCIAAPATLAIYYAWAIARVGRPPRLGPVVTRYQPPDGMSPAEVRYAWKGVVDERTVACVLAQLAIRGRITMERDHGGYEITRIATPPAGELASEEQVAMDWLFSNFLTRMTFQPGHSAQGFSMALRGALDRRLRNRYEATHYGYISLGLLGSLAAAYWLAHALGIAARVPPPMVYGLFMAALLASIVVGAILVPAVVDAARGIGSIGRILFGLVFSAFGVAGAIGVAVRLSGSVPVEFSVTVMAMAALNVVPAPWLRRVTQKGLEARGQIEGFRQFLAAVEQDHLDRMNPSAAHLESKDSLLPFAIALEVHETWGDALANACWPHLITG